MRILLIIAFLSFVPVQAAFAQDESKSPAPKAQEKVDWVTVESMGTLRNAKGGALERTLWKDQKRSDIEKMISILPNGQRIRSALSLQRRVLMSQTDTSLMKDDTGVTRGNDLLIQRINKLIDMGLYSEAWELYTQKAEDPYDVSIAQTGMLLLVMRNDLATACLEQKVFASRYPSDEFFKTLDAACADIMGGKAPDFPNSKVIQAVYHDAAYSAPATNPNALMEMTNLERALVLANGKIKYDGLTSKILADTPSTLVSLYLMDKQLPESAKALVKSETDRRGLTWYIPAVAQDPDWKKARDVGKDKEAQWPILESVLAQKRNPADLAAFTNMLADTEPANLSTDTLIRAMGAFLAASKPLPAYWLKQAQEKAAEKPIIYIYLQAFKSLTPTPDATVSSGNLQKAFESLKPEDSGQILAIIQTLDKDSGISDSLLQIYEKETMLTSTDNYVMPSVELNTSPETVLEKKHLGITVLGVLNSLAARPDNMYSGTVRKALNSMLNVGLIEDARLIGAETIASVLNKY